MKAKFLTLALLAVTATTVLISCDDKNKKEQTELEQDMNEASQEIEQETNETAQMTREEMNQDWDNFVATSDEMYNRREAEISGIRAEIAKADKAQRARLNQEIDDLEKKNLSLKERIDLRTQRVKEDLSAVNEKSIEDHRAARKQFESDMSDIGSAIGNFFTKDKN